MRRMDAENLLIPMMKEFQFSTLPGVRMLVLLFGTIVFVHFCNGKSEGDGRERVDNCGSSSHVGY